MSMAVHFMRIHKLFDPTDPEMCVGWSTTLRMLPGYKPQPLWAVPTGKAIDPDARLEPVVFYRERLEESWGIEGYRATGDYPRSWEDVNLICQMAYCLNFYHMRLTSKKINPWVRFKTLISAPTTEDPGDPDYCGNYGVEGAGHRIWLGQSTPIRDVERKLKNGTVKTYHENAYPVFSAEGRTVSVRTLIYRAVARRQSLPIGEDMLSYEPTRTAAEDTAFDPIPPGYIVTMDCGVSMCVEPSHMALRVRGANNLASLASRRKKTACVRGHEYVDGSYYTDSRGLKVCRECSRIRRINYLNRAIRRTLDDRDLPEDLISTDSRVFAPIISNYDEDGYDDMDGADEVVLDGKDDLAFDDPQSRRRGPHAENHKAKGNGRRDTWLDELDEIED